MVATFQVLLCVVMPELLKGLGKTFDLYNQQNHIKDIKLYIRKKAAQQCLLAVYQFEDVDLAYRVLMLQK